MADLDSGLKDCRNDNSKKYKEGLLPLFFLNLKKKLHDFHVNMKYFYHIS